MMLAMMVATAAEAQFEGRISIDAEDATYDHERGATHLRDNVRITRGSLEVTADEGFSYRGDNGLQRVELFGEPVRWQALTEDGTETTGHADQVVYDLLARTVTLIGNAYIEEPRGTFSGSELVYNLDTQKTEGRGGIQMTVEPEAIGEDDEDPPEPD
ncbi:lipopolysaccharide transport periplasmic protein LptA [Wenzhouxiangella sp. XN201]|uniref:lipopolysaccharide transport periplasmic protein LptA n=1 Tax=Wenzhouxiangella sp. XN201 TaxID=2710755 RepID=UPI0013C553C7|nr:lipopolysaccharide transport periplasmic protein LptA [Wenzhouxiangella sp. XN201]NEZ04670.1 lipopolysaccharide transport periplasmic protein LptA [Wenzhouxiangella sp. XN201]